jgi:HSP20 family protein
VGQAVLKLARTLLSLRQAVLVLPKSIKPFEECLTTIPSIQEQIAMSVALKPRWSVMFPSPFAREVNDLFDTLVHRPDGTAGWQAPAAIWEEDGRWCLDIELPGVKQEDVDVTLEKNALRVVAERHAPEDRKYFHQERNYGRIERLITLPEAVDADGIEAELRDGVLTLSLAKRPELQPRKISVKAS